MVAKYTGHRFESGYVHRMWANHIHFAPLAALIFLQAALDNTIVGESNAFSSWRRLLDLAIRWFSDSDPDHHFSIPFY